MIFRHGAGAPHERLILTAMSKTENQKRNLDLLSKLMRRAKRGVHCLFHALLFSFLFAHADQPTLTDYTMRMKKAGAFVLDRPDTISLEKPLPIVIILHGCSGVKQVEATYAEIANVAGWVSLIVDSLSVRGINDQITAKALVCSSIGVSGQDRAKDILAAIEYVSQEPDIDVSKVALVGFSHGGWAVLDFLSGAPGDAGLHWTGLKDSSLKRPEILGAFVNYPYCMHPARSVKLKSLASNTPVQMILASNDKITFSTPCRRLSKVLQAKDAPIKCRILKGATHAFDEKAHDGKIFGRTRYHAEHAQTILAQFGEFLTALNDPRLNPNEHMIENCGVSSE